MRKAFLCIRKRLSCFHVTQSFLSQKTLLNFTFRSAFSFNHSICRYFPRYAARTCSFTNNSAPVPVIVIFPVSMT